MINIAEYENRLNSGMSSLTLYEQKKLIQFIKNSDNIVILSLCENIERHSRHAMESTQNDYAVAIHDDIERIINLITDNADLSGVNDE